MIKITTKKVVGSNGKKYREFVKFSVLNYDCLPEKYLKSNKTIYIENKTLFVKGFAFTGFEYRNYRIGDWMEEKTFQAFTQHLIEAGLALQKINKELKKLRAAWHGQETLII